MGKELAHCFFNKEAKQGPTRQRPDFREAKHAYRQLYKELAETTGEGNKSIHPAQQRRPNYRQQYEGSEKYTCTVHSRTGWKYYPRGKKKAKLKSFFFELILANSWLTYSRKELI